MFTFFQKKRFLADYLHGLVDMHNHILPGIDDGAKTVNESIELIQNFKNLGITNFICTPHIMHNYYPNTPATIRKAYGAITKELKKLGEKVSIDYSAEHMIDDNFVTILEKDRIIPLKTEYLLIEMSYLQPSINFDEALLEISKKRFYPIFAHPERYVYFHNREKVYHDLKSKGILFQLNLLSLTSDVYGSSVQKCALKLLEDGLLDYVATDVHNMRQLNMIKEIKVSSKTLNRLLPVIENTIRTFY